MKFDPDEVHQWLTDWTTALGASPFLQLRSGPPEASTSATATGILIVEIPLPSSPFSSPSGGLITKAGSWLANSAGVGVIGHCRFLNNAKTECRMVGTVTQAIAYALTAGAAIATNVLQVADTSGMTVGAGVAGSGIEDGTTVAALTSTTVTLSRVLTAAMLSADTIVVGDTSGDMLISGAYIPTVGSSVEVVSFSLGWPTLI